MSRAVVLLSMLAGCAAPQPPPPEPAPCPVVEVEPCDAITDEQRAVLDAVDNIVDGRDGEPQAALAAVVAEGVATRAALERARHDLDACRRANAELQARVEQLEADLDEVKRLTIEMELKAK